VQSKFEVSVKINEVAQKIKRRFMKRIFNKAANHKEAEKWDIEQQINMTSRQRQKAAFELKKKFYGKNVPDVRASKHFEKFIFSKDN
jgi:hypothetical protein